MSEERAPYVFDPISRPMTHGEVKHIVDDLFDLARRSRPAPSPEQRDAAELEQRYVSLRDNYEVRLAFMAGPGGRLSWRGKKTPGEAFEEYCRARAKAIHEAYRYVEKLGR